MKELEKSIWYNYKINKIKLEIREEVYKTYKKFLESHRIEGRYDALEIENKIVETTI